MTNIVPQKFKIRWALDYTDGSTRRGLWCSQPDLPATRASMQPKHGLLRARIEAVEICGGHPLTVAEVSAQEFLEFRWISALRSGLKGKTSGGTIIGIELHTKKNVCVGFYTDGHCIVDNLSDRSKKYDGGGILRTTPKGIIQRSK